MATYRLDLSPDAEKAYCEFQQRSATSLKKGGFDDPCVAAFDELSRILDSITRKPAADEYRLSGSLACLFRVRGKWVRLSYVFPPSSPVVLVTSISDRLSADRDPDPEKVFALIMELIKNGHPSLRRSLGIPELTQPSGTPLLLKAVRRREPQ